MADNYIYIKGKRYNFYDTYKTYQEALKNAKYLKNKTKSRFFILIVEKGFPFPKKLYKLYLTRVMRFGW